MLFFVFLLNAQQAFCQDEKVFLESDYIGEKPYVRIGGHEFPIVKHNDVSGIEIEGKHYPLREKLVCHQVIIKLEKSEKFQRNDVSVSERSDILPKVCEQKKNHKLLLRHYALVPYDVYSTCGFGDYHSINSGNNSYFSKYNIRN
jgi:hypothetical protein